MHRFVTGTTPRGNAGLFGIRDGTADGSLFGGVILNDEYRMRGLPDDLSGWALDIGSYAGHVTSALLADFPGLRVIAVDPVRENCDILRDARNQWYDGRLVVVEGAATCDAGANVKMRYDYHGAIEHAGGHTTDREYVHANRFMAGLWRQEDVPGTDIEVFGYSIGSLATMVGADRFAFCKIDCEGCEYSFLDDPDVSMIDIIVGEFHDGGPERISALLAPTHRVEILEDHGGTGIFYAERLLGRWLSDVEITR